MMTNRRLTQRGFTLIELMIVMSVIGIVSVFALGSNFFTSQRRARDAERKSDINQYRIALENFAASKGGLYPQRTAEVSAKGVLCQGDLAGYMAACPEDPKYPDAEYLYQSNGLCATQGDPCATQYVLWAETEAEVNFWVACSDGRTGRFEPETLNADDGVCPLGAEAPTGVPTSTPTSPPPPPPPTATPTPPSAPTSTPTPTPEPPLLFWEAEEDGVITFPFTKTNGYISQATTNYDDPSLGGKALYSFNLTTPGDYIIRCNVDGSEDWSNSFYVNIDSEPTDPYMIWDIVPYTTGFEERTVTWRGTGSTANPEFDPKVFSLGAGAHQLIFRGREADTKLDWLRLELYTP